MTNAKEPKRSTWKTMGLVVVAVIGGAILWGQFRDNAYYLTRPGNEQTAKANQFGAFSSGFLCLQAANAFCYSDRSHDRETEYACVTNGTLMHTITCGEKSIKSVGYAGVSTSEDPYAGRYRDEATAKRTYNQVMDRSGSRP